jgi:hypothetical protein
MTFPIIGTLVWFAALVTPIVCRELEISSYPIVWSILPVRMLQRSVVEPHQAPSFTRSHEDRSNINPRIGKKPLFCISLSSDVAETHGASHAWPGPAGTSQRIPEIPHPGPPIPLPDLRGSGPGESRIRNEIPYRQFGLYPGNQNKG